MSALADIQECFKARRAFAQAHGQEGVFYVGLDTPIELIEAGGFAPIRIIPDLSRRGADRFAEGAGHPWLRAIAAALEDGSYGDVRRLIISTTPSAYCALYAFLREAQRGGFGYGDVDIHLFDLNRAPHESVAPLRARAVAGLSAKIEAWRGAPIGDDALGEAIGARNRIRALQEDFQRLRSDATARISGSEALGVFGAAETMSRDDYARVLTNLIEGWRDRAPVPGRRAIYSGTETASLDLYKRLEQDGYVIVADDQDGGSRGIGPRVEERGDPIVALAQAYFARAPAPARWALERRAPYLVDLACTSAAETVLFQFAPWDHPPAWDFPVERQALADAGVKGEILEWADG